MKRHITSQADYNYTHAITIEKLIHTVNIPSFDTQGCSIVRFLLLFVRYTLLCMFFNMYVCVVHCSLSVCSYMHIPHSIVCVYVHMYRDALRKMRPTVSAHYHACADLLHLYANTMIFFTHNNYYTFQSPSITLPELATEDQGMCMYSTV